MPSDTFVNHPFPYFGIAVTRDLQAVAAAIKAKYDTEKKFENRPGQDGRYKRFTENVLLIADRGGLGTGNYEPNAQKVEAIVGACLKMVEGLLNPIVHPAANSVHPKQIDFLVETARDTLGMDERLARDFLNQRVQSRGIKLDIKVPPPPPPAPAAPVSNLHTELRDQGVRLRWEKPLAQCDFVLIRRTDWPASKSVQSQGNFWDDDDAEPGQRVEYEVSSVYLGNRQGGTNRLAGIARGLVEGVQGACQGDHLELSWRVTANTQSISVFRGLQPFEMTSDSSGCLRIPTTPLVTIPLPGNSQKYLDRDVERGTTYFYVIVAHHAGGVASYSRCLGITVPRDPPPPPAGSVKAIAYPGRIYLSWPPQGGKETTYLVTRTDSPDVNQISPARKQWRLSATTLEDLATVSGTSYWYSVATEQGGIVSRHPTTEGPVLAIREVEELHAEPGAEQILLSWKPPAGVKRVDVRRGEREVPESLPSGTGGPVSGTLVPVTGANQVIDTGLTNGVTYFYRVSCVFVRCDGREMSTLGECVKSTPFDLPSPVSQLRIEGVEVSGARALPSGRPSAKPGESQKVSPVRISWQAASPMKPESTVQVFRSGEVWRHPVGSVLQVGDLQSLGPPLSRAERSSVTDHAPDPAAPLYLVFAVNRFRAVYCGLVASVQAGPLDVTYQHGNATVTWDWPQFANAAELAHWRPGESGIPEVRRVARKTGGRGNELFTGLTPGWHEWRVLCLVEPSQPHLMAGPPRSVGIDVGQATSLRWSLPRPYWQRLTRQRSRTIHLEPNGRLANVRLRLVAKANRIPENPTDGQTLMEWPGTVEVSLNETSFDVPLANWNGARNTEVFCRLFADPDGSVLIIPPTSVDERRL